MLNQKTSLLQYKGIANGLHKSIVNKIDLHLSSVVTSTNDVIQAIPKVTNKTTILCAEYQTKARGRRGRFWYNKPGSSICMSVRIQTTNNLHELSGLNIVVAVSIIQAINSIQKTEAKLKWPNDIIILTADDYYKIGGVLIEIIATKDATYDIIIGVGLNHSDANNISFNAQPQLKIADLQSLYKKKVDHNIIISRLINSICNNTDIFFNSGLKPFMKLWETFDAFYNKKVSVITEEKIFRGTALGINNKGGIIVAIKGSNQHFYSADISLRPI